MQRPRSGVEQAYGKVWICDLILDKLTSLQVLVICWEGGQHIIIVIIAPVASQINCTQACSS